MRDPKRIKPMLKLLERVWTKHPDLRLGQLLENATEYNSTPIFYTEDDMLEKDLRKLEKQS